MSEVIAYLSQRVSITKGAMGRAIKMGRAEDCYLWAARQKEASMALEKAKRIREKEKWAKK